MYGIVTIELYLLFVPDHHTQAALSMVEEIIFLKHKPDQCYHPTSKAFGSFPWHINEVHSN